MVSNKTFALLLALAAPAASAWFGSSSSSSSHEDDNVCKLYLAPSSMMGGLGVFAGVPLSEGKELSTEDAVIPLVDVSENHWGGYPWSSSYGVTLLEGQPVHAVLPVLGSASNRHDVISNASPLPVKSDTVGLHRSRDPGVGSFSYDTMKYKTTSAIPAGGEILLSDAEVGWGELASQEDYDEVDRILQKVNDVVIEVNGDGSLGMRDEILQLMRSGMASPAKEIFPQNVQQLERAVKSGAANALRSQDLLVTVDWLQEHGMCLDNIKVGTSTIPQAGRGAFATRLLKKGSVVAPIPVHQMLHDDMILDDDRPQQLLVNYCFGHLQSSLLLCPYAGGAPFVNHGSGKKANVRLEWSSKLDSKHDAWTSVDQVIEHPEAGLVLQFVATRDIQPGEEILLNYGDEWESAWTEHLESWKPDEEEGGENYKSAAEWNAMNLPQIMTTEEEEEGEPYPENLFLGFQMDYDPSIGRDDTEEENEVLVRKVSYENVSRRPTSTVWPSSVLERVNNDSYTIILHNHPALDEEDQYSIPPTETVKITGVPREAIIFVDQVDSTDMHLPEAFRHEIQIPDDIFPKAWLDVKETEP